MTDAPEGWRMQSPEPPNVAEYVRDYEFRGDTDYKPNAQEQILIEDAIHGYLAALSASPPPPELRDRRAQKLEERLRAEGHAYEASLEREDEWAKVCDEKDAAIAILSARLKEADAEVYNHSRTIELLRDPTRADRLIKIAKKLQDTEANLKAAMEALEDIREISGDRASAGFNESGRLARINDRAASVHKALKGEGRG